MEIKKGGHPIGNNDKVLIDEKPKSKNRYIHNKQLKKRFAS
jgi:hypothetical protein